MNSSNAMKKHFGNISRAVGHNVGKYNYIVSQNELINAYVQMKDELGYPLAIDSKNRRAIIYNKKGLEKEISKTINKVIVDNIKLLDSFVAQDIVNKVNGAINGSVAKSSGSSFTSMFGSALAKGLINSVWDILDDMMNGE